jgi:hypothetical protein
MMVCLWVGFYTVEEVIGGGNPGNPCIYRRRIINEKSKINKSKLKV